MTCWVNLTVSWSIPMISLNDNVARKHHAATFFYSDVSMLNSYEKLPYFTFYRHRLPDCHYLIDHLVDTAAYVTCHTNKTNRSWQHRDRVHSQGLYLLSRTTSYRKISWSREVARFGFRLFQLLWNLTGTSAEMPVKFQCETIIITLNLAASRLHEIWR